MTRLAKYSAELYAGLEAETGVATGFKQNGSISVALTGERLEELKRGASMAKTFGLAVEVLSPQDIAGMYPLLNLDSVTGGVFLPKDGRSEEHTSELQSLMRISYAVFCLTKKKKYENDATFQT